MKTGWLALLVVLAAAPLARAQGIPTEPVSFADGRVVFGAEATATYATADPGFFNFTDYESSALRNLRIGITTEVRASRNLQLLGELRMDADLGALPQADGGRPQVQPFALYARIRPWPERRFDINVGRIPPTFGAFGRGTYGTSNLLIGSPLAYQYLTSLRTDALPSTTDELLRMRGRGWSSAFSIGNRADDRGLPIINSFRWDTGVQVHGVNGIVEWTGAVTTGSLSNPRVDDDNDGRQMAGRAVLRPAAGVAVGASVSRGAFLNRSLEDALTADQRLGDGIQQAVGMDIEYSVGRFLARSEVILTRWTLPIALTSPDPERLGATALLGEARYRLFPGLQIAARAERLSFDHVRTLSGPRRWEAPVNRVEVGTSYSIIRNVIVKASWQRDTRDGGRIRRATLGALQVIYWF